MAREILRNEERSR